MNNVSQCSICGNGAQFMCQCLDPYCSQQCQFIDWPIHRKNCSPLPELIAVENLNIPWKADYRAPVVQYKRKEPINYRPNTTLHKWNSNAQIEWKPKHRCRSIASSSMEPNNNYNSLRCFSDYRKIIEAKPQMWERSYQLSKDEKMEVIVQYFVQSPTKTCWVMKREHNRDRELFMKDMHMLHNYKEAMERNEIKVNRIYAVFFEGAHHRGVVIYSINTLEVVVWLIDIGRTLHTQVNAIKALDPLSKSKNAFAFAIQFEDPIDLKIGEILKIAEITKDLDGHGLTNVKLVKMKSPEETTKESISLDIDRLAKRHFREYVRDTSVFTYLNLKLIPLPKGNPIELYCLDYSNIKKGCISVCVNDPQKIKEIDDLPNAILEHCLQLKNVKTYCPKLYELCLVYHDGFKEWYRAECIQVMNARTFKVIFTDYGTYRVVGSSYIRQMDHKFMQPVIMHMCIIDGVPTNPSEAVVEKLTSYFDENPIFHIEGAEKCDFSGETLTKISLSDLLF